MVKTILGCLAVAIVSAGAALYLPEGSHLAPFWTTPLNSSATYEGGKFEVALDTTTTPKVRRRQRTPRPGEAYIVIDRYSNRLYLRTVDSVLLAATCSTGSGSELSDTASGRHWKFETPRGVFVVDAMIANPWWRKPDWAYIEEGEPIPSNERDRVDPNMMGDFAIGFGDGYYVHGTIYERLLGVSVTHGCVRLGSEDLRKLYQHTRIGMLLYVY